jgi:peptide-O-fucosyltransferase
VFCRRDVLNSTDTILHSNWENQQPVVGGAKGGNYLSVHWRRRDFVYAHKNEVPSIEGTVKQLLKITKRLGLNTVFIATDAETKEYRELNERLSESGIQVARFTNNTLSDGAVSIVDQVTL